MANKTLSQTAPNTNYEDGSDWAGGVAPVAGDTVTIGSLPQGGPVPITITGVAISNQQITLTGSGGLGTAGGTSFDAQTSLTGTTDTSNASFDGTFTNGGTITDVSIAMTASGGASPTFNNTGSLVYNRAPIANPFFTISTGLAGATLDNTGTITLTTVPSTFQTEVTLGSPLSGTGVVNITGAHPNATAPVPYSANSVSELLDENGDPISGSNTFNLNNGELELLSVGTGTVNFKDASSILDFGSSIDFNAGLTIQGFQAGDVIGLGTSSVKAGSLSYNTATNTLSFMDSANGNATVSLHIVPTGTQAYTTASFSEVTNVGDFPQDQSIVTTAAAPCYCPGTLILTDRGEVPVEALRIGDRLITADGTAQRIKWIGRRAYAGEFVAKRLDILPVCIHAGALGDGLPRRDLHVSPLHAMFLDGALVPAGLLVNGASVTQAEAVESVRYIHLELDRHAVIWAEGAASESFVDDGSRGMFQNAHEFAGMYPLDCPVPAVYCAPRVEHGERLAAIRAEIDRRAGLKLPGAGEVLRGHVDGCEDGVVTGWVQSLAQPEAPVCVEIVVDGRSAGRTVANLFRPDLRVLGFGSGRHGFTIPVELTPRARLVEVRRVTDGSVVGTVRLRARRQRRAA